MRRDAELTEVFDIWKKFELGGNRGSFDLRLLLPLLGAICGLIAVHVSFGLARLADDTAVWPDLLNISRDRSLSEFLNHLLMIGIAASFVSAWSRTRDPLLISASLIVLLALADDALQLHERSADIIMLFEYHLVFGDEIFAAGEFAVWLILGAITLCVIALSWHRSSGATRSRLLPQAVLFLALVFFATVVDLFHGGAESFSRLAGALGIVEEGGEMLSIALMFSHAVPSFASP